MKSKTAKSKTLLIAGLACILIVAITAGYWLFISKTWTSKVAAQEAAASASSASQLAAAAASSSASAAESGQVPQDIIDRINAGDTAGLKIVFLTFDDGPSETSNQVLDVLDQYHVKATFFTNLHSDPALADVYRRIVTDGHTLANHTASHSYDLYTDDPTAFMEDVQAVRDYQTQVTGQTPGMMFRFPGGSLTASQACIDAIKAAGYDYVDWNVSSGDGSSTELTPEQVANNIISQVQGQDVSVALCHAEVKPTTLQALPTIFQTLQSQGYTFYPLTDKITNYPRQDD